MSTKISVNGFGRIGRNIVKAIFMYPEKYSSLEVVSVNDLTDPKTLAHLFKYDSINQKNNNAANLQGYNVKAVYTEPLFKRSLLEFSVGNSYTKNISSKTTYDFNRSNGKFDVVNKTLTNDYENTYRFTTAGLWATPLITAVELTTRL